MDRWQKEFGAGSRQLAIWNQEVASVYVALAPGTAVPDHPGLSVTPWPRTYRVTGGGARDALRPLLESGVAYLTDPSTRHPVELAAPSAGERVLDLCAAPGGKTWRLAHAVGPRGAVVAVDLPGSRLHRLRANADRHPCKNISVYAADVQDLSSLALPKFPLVLLDAPCSNTGVLQRRPDAKWRLEPADFSRLPQLQLSLLQAAAHKLALNGRLIYSTCSIESVENAGVVQAFLAQHREFRLTGIRLSYPWRAHHDGGAAFQLTRLALPPCVGA